MSLETRVGIVGVLMNLGYRKLWTLVFDELGLKIDDTFASSLEARNIKKGQKRKKQKSMKGKISKRKTGLAKYEVAHQEQMDNTRTGKTYGYGVALKIETKKATENSLRRAATQKKLRSTSHGVRTTPFTALCWDTRRRPASCAG